MGDRCPRNSANSPRISPKGAPEAAAAALIWAELAGWSGRWRAHRSRLRHGSGAYALRGFATGFKAAVPPPPEGPFFRRLGGSGGEGSPLLRESALYRRRRKAPFNRAHSSADATGVADPVPISPRKPFSMPKAGKRFSVGFWGREAAAAGAAPLSPKGGSKEERGGGDCLIKTPDSANGVAGRIGSDTCPSAGHPTAGGGGRGREGLLTPGGFSFGAKALWRSKGKGGGRCRKGFKGPEVLKALKGPSSPYRRWPSAFAPFITAAGVKVQ